MKCACATSLTPTLGISLSGELKNLRAVCARPQTIAMARADVNDYSAEVISKIVTLHNNTVDQVDRKIDEYLPRVRKYDHM